MGAGKSARKGGNFILGKYPRRPGGADIDADAGQGHMVLDPKRVFLERAAILEIVMVMVGLRVVPMGEPIAIAVIGQAVTLCFGLVIPLRHRSPAENLCVERSWIICTFIMTRQGGSAGPCESAGPTKLGPSEA